MNESELDAVLRAAVRHDPSRAAGVLEAAGPDLVEEIMHTPHTYRTGPDDVPPAEPELELSPLPPAPTRRRRSVAVVLVAAAVALAVAVPAYAFRDRHHGSHGSAGLPAAAPAAGKTGSPDFVVVDRAGWKVDHVDQTLPQRWDLGLLRDGVTLEITADPASAGSRSDPASTPDPSATWTPKATPVLGTQGLLDREGPDDWAVDLTARGEDLRVRADLARKPFIALLKTLRWADAATFAASMPASVVTPARELPVAREMLGDVPLPPGLQPADLVHGYTNDRYQFAAHVTGRVTCDWIALELKSRASGDKQTRREADTALRSSHQWAVLQEIESQGGWSQAVWEMADATANGGQVIGGKKVSVADSYRSALGCDD